MFNHFHLVSSCSVVVGENADDGDEHRAAESDDDQTQAVTEIAEESSAEFQSAETGVDSSETDETEAVITDDEAAKEEAVEADVEEDADAEQARPAFNV